MKTKIYAELGKDTTLEEFMEAAGKLTEKLEGDIEWVIAHHRVDKLQLHVIKEEYDLRADVEELSRQTMHQHEMLKIALIGKGIITKEEYKQYWKKAIDNLEE